MDAAGDQCSTSGDPNAFKSARGCAVATVERTKVPERVRLWFHAADDAAGDVVIEQAYPADNESKEVKNFYARLDNL